MNPGDERDVWGPKDRKENGRTTPEDGINTVD
jgi:hypothetical protein